MEGLGIEGKIMLKVILKQIGWVGDWITIVTTTELL
jgi:hypothetical protein